MSDLYAFAPNPFFWSFQSEGFLRKQMAFARLAGCSVGCTFCDTDWSVHTRLTADDAAAAVHLVTPRDVVDRWTRWTNRCSLGPTPRA